MNERWALVWPGTGEWRALPVRLPTWRRMVGAWAIGVLTTVGAFVADRGWETLDADAWAGPFRVTDMLGLSGLFLSTAFTLGGWALGGRAVIAAPLVLAYAAVPHTVDHYASAWVWWGGAAAAVVWAFVQAGASVQQLRAVRALARRSDTGRTAELDESSLETIRKARRSGLYWAWGLSGVAALGCAVTAAVLVTELGRTAEELGDASVSDVLATGAAAAAILAIGQWVRCAWRAIARTAVGQVIWQVPVGPGPVWGLSSPREGQAGMLAFEQARSIPGCSCIEDWRRADPDADNESMEDYGVPAAEYCPVHGIDQINALSPEQFTARAAEPWLWDPDAMDPSPTRPAENRPLLVGFAGHAHLGFPARFKNEQVDLDPVGSFLLEEETSADREDQDTDWDAPRRPTKGVLDRIDLRPAGLAGDAVRYRHGRAWFNSDTADKSSSDAQP